jgi:glycine cleavage system H protein
MDRDACGRPAVSFPGLTVTRFRGRNGGGVRTGSFYLWSASMAVIRGFTLPENLFYLVEKHVWAAEPVDGVCRVGMTPVAYQLMRHSLVAISIKESAIGSEVPKGKSVAMIESVKFIGPLPAPFTGVLLRGNPLLADDPSIAEKDPYGNGWIVEMSPTVWSTAAAGLVTGEAGLTAYRKLLESQNIDTNT